MPGVAGFEPRTTEWREQFLAVLLRFTLMFGLVTAVPSVWRATRAGLWSIVIVDLAALSFVSVIARRRDWPYRVRSVSLVSLAYALGVFFMVKVAPVSLIYLMAFPMLVALLLGVRYAVGALALNAVSMLVVGYLAGADLPLYGFEGMPLAKWAVITLNFAFVDGILTMATALLVQRLEQSLAQLHDLNTRLEQRVQERTAQLEAANRELEAFSYAVSHDLRAPLGTIDGFSGLLANHVPAGDERGRHYLARLRAGVHQLADLIEGMLALAYISRATLQYDEVALSAIAEDLIAAYRRKAPERRVEVTVEPGIRATGDERLLRQVLDNLLGNAWKFTAHEPQARIAFRRFADADGEAVYEVSDNGAGFDMGDAGKLFKAFYRLHTVDQFPGTGVGLASVQRIVARHRGRVWTEAQTGRGAAFRFTLGPRAD